MVGEVMKRYFYPGPTEVQYLRDGTWSKGIAYREVVIDLYSGWPRAIEVIYMEAEEMGIDEDAAIVEKCEWIDILKFMNE